MTMKRARKHKPEKIWLKECDDLIRGAAGGFLFGIPLLYTMEVWWIGSFTEPPVMLAAIAATFVVVFLLNRTEGFRKTKDIRQSEAVMDTIEAIAIGIVCATCILVLLREITLDTSLGEALGKVIFESVPFALGVALARSLLSGDRYQSSNSQDNPSSANETTINATFTDIGATLIGATLIAFNIAPTDEVSMLAAASSPPWLLAIMVASVLISYGIVFQAGFTNQQQRMQQQGIFQRPLSETVFSYLVSILASALMLWFFQQLSFDDPWQMWLSYTLILGLPATVGGAAGRLVA
ncbi:TIGR02587 family membrane protein [Coleofasciculus sp. H7-2]|uniref:TIGR02587 family membrane protein n=1 Tax=Coleofasciculus sp. H7-2 TaxID=3351545 RepID=UPI0036728B14